MPTFRNQSGFVLAATIILLAVITIAASIFALWVERRIEEAGTAHTEQQLAIDHFSTLNALLYIMSTGQMESRGIYFSPTGKTSSNHSSLLRLDDRPYHGYGKTFFSVQDEAGLLNANFFNAARFSRLLAQFEIPQEKRGELLAKLRDYIDTNDSFHLNGAERPHYEKAGKPGPANRELFTSQELASVIGWDEHPGLWQHNRLPRLTTTQFAGATSLYFAPKEILQTLPQLSSKEIELIVNLRQDYTITRLSQLEQILGRKIPSLDMEILFIPSLHHRITLTDSKSQKATEYHIELTPFSLLGVPWQIDSIFSFSQTQQDDMLTDHETLPFFKETMGTDQ